MNLNFLKVIRYRKIITSLCFVGTFLVSQDFDSGIEQTTKHSFQVSLFSEGYQIPWGMAFLPNKHLLVSDKSGELYIVSPDGKKRNQISGVPKVLNKSQGGLLDIAVHPDFSKNNLI